MTFLGFWACRAFGLVVGVLGFIQEIITIPLGGLDMEHQYTGKSVWVVGVWRGNCWIGESVYGSEIDAAIVARLWNIGSVVHFTVERFKEIKGASSAAAYWYDKGVR